MLKFLNTIIIFSSLMALVACEDASVALRIKANVSEGTVYIDGKKVGTTPMDIAVAPGDLEIEVRQSGHSSFKKTYTLAANTSKVIEALLYKTVRIGKQVWMAKNLNVEVAGSSCYDDDPANCTEYGRLYTWEAAKRAADLVPGWHLPTDEEWKTLEMALEMSRSEADDTGWRGKDEKIGAKLKNGAFNALLAGYRNGGGGFSNLGSGGDFWSASPFGSSSAWYRNVYASNGDVYRDYSGRTNRYSVRLVKDE